MSPLRQARRASPIGGSPPVGGELSICPSRPKNGETDVVHHLGNSKERPVTTSRRGVAAMAVVIPSAGLLASVGTARAQPADIAVVEQAGETLRKPMINPDHQAVAAAHQGTSGLAKVSRRRETSRPPSADPRSVRDGGTRAHPQHRSTHMVASVSCREARVPHNARSVHAGR
jgi:hypothetical protein